MENLGELRGQIWGLGNVCMGARVLHSMELEGTARGQAEDGNQVCPRPEVTELEYGEVKCDLWGSVSEMGQPLLEVAVQAFWPSYLSPSGGLVMLQLPK